MDPRFSQYQQSSMGPSYPQASSPPTMHSTYQSSASLSSLASISTSPSQTNMHSRQSPVLRSAPLPSPDAKRQPAGGNYFGAMMPAPAMQQPTQQFGQRMNSISEQPQQQHQYQQEQYQHQQPQAFGQHQGQRGNSGGVPDTAAYLQGFNLLAEAAKRAEMACLMRDLDDFEM